MKREVHYEIESRDSILPIRVKTDLNAKRVAIIQNSSPSETVLVGASQLDDLIQALNEVRQAFK